MATRWPRSVRNELDLLRPGGGLCLHPRCLWHPDDSEITVDEQCATHTRGTGHPSAFKPVTSPLVPSLNKDRIGEEDSTREQHGLQAPTLAAVGTVR